MKENIEELALAVGLHDNVTLPNLLAEVIAFLHTSTARDKYWDADRLRKCNDNLASQITMLELRLAAEPDPKTTCPTKRKVEDCDWSSPPSKRFLPSPSQDPELSPCKLQRRPVSELHCPSMLDSTPQLQALRHGDDAFVFPLPCIEERLSPARLPEASIPDVGLSSSPLPTPSPSYCSIVEPSVKNEDHAGMATIWTLDATAGSRISLDQFDLWATEEDLVSLYL
ncbi:uncharacterized protein LOC134673500 [Cydia fagiglandana]|uniref:uncharacterized protein LOC134673500 n=1 Tax=Cydia fagiglandana TaxID=1458189 RepID=UPI002FEE3AB4